MSTFLSILLGLFMFGVIILIHELGHFLFAKAFHVGIEEFAIGMGPRILSRVGKDGVHYSLRLVPMGGFVSMIGEDEASENESALCNKPVWQRIIIVAAGAGMNLLLGFLLMGAYVLGAGDTYSTTVEGFRTASGIQYEEIYGIRVGDTIEKIGNRRIHVRDDFEYEVMFRPNEPLDVTVRRDGERVVIPDVVFETYTEGGITFGKAGFILTTVLPKTPFEVVRQAFFKSTATVHLVWDSIRGLFKGAYGVESMSGPVGMIGEVKETVALGWEVFAFFVALLTINLGVMNLLPLPALDGGRLLFMLIELVRGKPINPKYEGYVHAAGLVLLLGLSVFVMYNDIVRLFVK